jgi:hypothetical protein
MKKKGKHPKDMTNEELLGHIFHPKVVEHIKKHVAEIDAAPVRRPKKVVK